MQVSSRNESSGISQISTVTLMPNEIKAIPILFGEKDPIKAFQLLPGVQQASEGSSMFLVRGGGADQNLLLLGFYIAIFSVELDLSLLF